MAVARLAFGTAARGRLARGARILADAVRVSLGPAGRTVLIQGAGAAPLPTRDGARIAEEIELADRFTDIGARLIRRAASRSVAQAGDGRTTAVVLAAAILDEGLKRAASGLDPLTLKTGLDRAATLALAALETAAKPVAPGPALMRITAVAAGGDAGIGAIAAQAVAAVGADGVVSVEPGQARETVWEIVHGIRFDQGYASPYFMTDPDTALCTHDRPLILLYDGRLDRHEPLLRLLEAAVRARRPLAVIAETIEGEALRTLTANKIRGGLRLVAARAPHFGDRRRVALEDAATLTGARVVARDKGLSLADVGPEVLGSARRIQVSTDATLIIEGHGDPALIADRRAGIRAARDYARTEADRALLDERLARLSGGVAVVRVGGASAAEIAIGVERARAATRAARAARAGGVVPGGGAALLHAARTLAAEDPAARILAPALAAPLRQIADNAGAPGKAIAAQIAQSGDPDLGFDAGDRVVKNMVEAGILDPLAVVRAALSNAVSVAGMLLSAEVVIAKPPPPPPGGEIPFGPITPDFTADELPGFGLA